MVAVDDAVGRVREFLQELVARRRTAQHRVDRLGLHLLLLHGAHQQGVFVEVIGGDDDVGVERLHAQHDVVEVARGVGVFDDLFHLKAITRQLARQEVGRARAKEAFFMNDHHRLGRLARHRVEHMQVAHGDLRAGRVTRAKAEGVFQAALHDLVGHAHVHHMGQTVTRRGLCGGQADGRGKSAHHG